MNKLLIAVALCAALTACKKEEAAPAADAAAPAATEAAAPAADTAPAATSTLPQVCQDFLARAQACFDKSTSNMAAAPLKDAFDKTRASWEAAADKSGLEMGCKAANEQFAQTVAMLKCE